MGPPPSAASSRPAAAPSSTHATAGRCTAAGCRSGSTGGPGGTAQPPRRTPPPPRRPTLRPLVQGRDPIGAIRDLARDRARFYGPADRLNSASEVTALVE